MNKIVQSPLFIDQEPSCDNIFDVDFSAIFDKRHGEENGNHLACVVESNLVISTKTSAFAHVFDVFFGVVLVVWCPTAHYFRYRVALVPHDVVPKHDEGGAYAPLHFLELLKDVVSRMTDLALPVIPHPNVQWVVVPDSPWNLVLS